ncbi:MAG: threonine/serine dehydratase [Candidatus Aminicenantes bacterium]|nr:threonine/serine dehydratase [Candidatus Aminicenantes bacterium]
MEKVRQETLDAEERIREHIIETRLEYSPFLSDSAGGSVYLKCENLQITNSFKLRGALNKLLSLTEEERERGVTTASTGNHGSAVAYGMDKFNINGLIYLPENAAQTKIDVIRSYNAEIKFFSDDCAKAEVKARQVAQEKGMVFVSPYNDMKVVGGQGTIAIELMRQLEKIDVVICPVGGGGLIGGIAGYLKSHNERIEIIGAQPEYCTHMYEAIKAGKIIEVPARPTFADGVEGAVEAGSVTFDICRECVDDFILVSEEEIKAALRLVMEKHFMLVEGAGVLSIAAYLKAKDRFKNKNVVLVISGGKIGLDKLKKLLCPTRVGGR